MQSKTLSTCFLIVCFFQTVIFAVSSSAFTLSDTGQEKCSDMDGNEISCPAPGEYLYGQDANYGASQGKVQPSFNPSNNVVLDNNTNLMWQRTDDNEVYTVEEATNFCQNLELDGYDDWRVPEIYELTTIINYGKLDPAIDQSVFPNTKGSTYVSATVYSSNTNAVWDVNFDYGRTGLSVLSTGPGNVFVRCVRGEVLSYGHFEPLDEAVVDHATGLMWQKSGGSAIIIGWDEALSYCNGLDLLGHDDWRLPDIRELLTIVNYDLYAPAIETSVFELLNPTKPNYWSSTSRPFSSYAWHVNFYYGRSATPNKALSENVRCVRTGLNGPGPSSYKLDIDIDEDGGSGTVFSNPAGINCVGDVADSDCSKNFNENTMVALTAMPNAFSKFSGWSGASDCTDEVAGLDTFVVMDKDITCKATFSNDGISSLLIELDDEGSGTVTSSPTGIICRRDMMAGCKDSFDDYTVVALTATPDSGSTFSGWSGVPDCADGVVTMDLDAVCIARFSLKENAHQLEITLAGSGIGSVTSNPVGINCFSERDGVGCAAYFDDDTPVTLTITPDSTSRFDRWFGLADCTDAVVTMDQDKFCGVYFEKIVNISPIMLLLE